MRVASLAREDPVEKEMATHSSILFYLFNWRVITIQYCDDFCHTSIWIGHRYTWTSPTAEVIKSPPTIQEMQETGVWSLGQEDPLEKQRATHSSILAWKIPWTRGAWQAIGSIGSKRVRYHQAHIHSFIHRYTCIPSILNPSPTSLPTVSLQGQPISVFFPEKPHGQWNLASVSKLRHSSISQYLSSRRRGE